MLSDIEIAQKAEMKPITEIGESIGIPATELENYGLFDVFSSIRFAPSHINAQPWRFLLKDDGTITLYMDKSKGQKSYVDIGVVMYYYEAMLKNTGTEKTWTLIEGADVNGLEPVATISL